MGLGKYILVPFALAKMAGSYYAPQVEIPTSQKIRPGYPPQFPSAIPSDII